MPNGSFGLSVTEVTSSIQPFIPTVLQLSSKSTSQDKRLLQQQYLVHDAIERYSEIQNYNKDLLIFNSSIIQKVRLKRRDSKSIKTVGNLLHNDSQMANLHENYTKTVPVTTTSFLKSFGNATNENQVQEDFNFHRGPSLTNITESQQHLAVSPPQNEVEASFPLYIRVWASIALIFIAVVGVVGNVIVPLVVCLNKDLRHSTNFFLINLAAADLLVLLVCLPTAMVELHVRPDTWVLGSIMCE